MDALENIRNVLIVYDFLDGDTYSSIAKRNSVSVPRVRQLVRGILRKLHRLGFVDKPDKWYLLSVDDIRSRRDIYKNAIIAYQLSGKNNCDYQ